MQMVMDIRIKASCITGVKSTNLRDSFPNIAPAGKETRSNRIVIIPIVCLRLLIRFSCQYYKKVNLTKLLF